MKKATIKSLICQNCFEIIPNSFFVNSTIPTISYNWCQQKNLVNGVCPVCKNPALFYVADPQLAGIATIFYKLGYDVLQTRDGYAFFKSNDYFSDIFYGPYLLFGVDPYVSADIQKEMILDLYNIASPYNWNISGSLVDNYSINHDNQHFESIEELNKYPEYFIWRVGIGLDYRCTQTYLSTNIMQSNNNFISTHEKDKFINEELCKFFGYKCQELYNALSTEFFDKWRTKICQELSMMRDQ